MNNFLDFPPQSLATGSLLEGEFIRHSVIITCYSKTILSGFQPTGETYKFHFTSKRIVVEPFLYKDNEVKVIKALAFATRYMSDNIAVDLATRRVSSAVSESKSRAEKGQILPFAYNNILRFEIICSPCKHIPITKICKMTFGDSSCIYFMPSVCYSGRNGVPALNEEKEFARKSIFMFRELTDKFVGVANKALIEYCS
jgi:hypothetical protein